MKFCAPQSLERDFINVIAPQSPEAVSHVHVVPDLPPGMWIDQMVIKTLNLWGGAKYGTFYGIFQDKLRNIFQGQVQPQSC